MYQNSRWRSGVCVDSADQNGLHRISNLFSPSHPSQPDKVFSALPGGNLGPPIFSHDQGTNCENHIAKSLNGEANIIMLPPHSWPPSGMKRESI